jgi:creatinine amidohydrolase
VKLGGLAYPEVRSLVEAGAVALWPIGSTEAHGPHLPLSTDVMIAEETCKRAIDLIEEALELKAVILPPLAFTVTEYASPFSGTISIPAETAVAYVRDVLVSAAAQGFRAICMVNAHLEPAHRTVLRKAREAATGRAKCPLAIADPCDRRWVSTMTAEFQSGSCHAGQYETSLVLAAGGPVLAESTQLPPVEIDLMAEMKAGRKTFPEMGAERCHFGRPADASINEGDKTYRQLAEIVVTMLREALEKKE